MREIEITYTNVSPEDMVRELAKYIDNGYRFTSYRTSHSMYEAEVIIGLVKLDK